MSLNTDTDLLLLKQALDCSNTCILNENFSVYYASENFCTLTAYSDKEMNGKSLLSLMYKIQADTLYNFITNTLVNNETWKGEFQLNNKNNDVIYLDTTIKPATKNNSLKYYIATFTDTHNRKQLIDSLKQRAHQQGLIAILGQLSLNNIPINDLLDQTLAVICGSFKMKSGAMLEMSIDGTTALIRTAYNTLPIKPGLTLINIEPNSLFSYALQNDNPVACELLETDKRFNIPNFLLKENAKSAVCSLIGDRNHPFGIITIFSNEIRTFNIDEINFLKSVSNILAEAINRKNMEKALRHEQQLSKKYIDVAEVIFIVLDIKENIILANHHAASVLGYSQEDLNGISFFDIFTSEEARSKAKSDFYKLLNNQKTDNINLNIYDNASPIINKKNQTRYINWKNSTIHDSNNEVSSVLFSGEDITDLLAYEREQKHLEKQLNQAQKMEAVGMLAGGIAHDFNNILASILGFSDLALEAIENDDELNLYLNHIKESGLKARDIIAQMQSINLQDDITNKAILLPSLLKGTLQMLRSALPSSINMQLNIRDNTPAVHINASKFNQIVMHLLTNAGNVLNGKGQINIDLCLINFSNKTCSACNHKIDNEFVVFSIHDNGPGLSNSEVASILNNATDTSTSSLNLVSKLVHDSNGHILISNNILENYATEKNKSPGTSVQLLFEIPELPAEKSPSFASQSINLEAIKNKHIMIVDDENSVATYMGELFKGAGFNVSVFCDSPEALKKFSNTPDDYDFIVTDQTMPVLTGDVLAEKMLEIKPNIPIIICSGHNDIFNKKNAEDINVRAFLQKPIDSAELLHAVMSLLN